MWRKIILVVSFILLLSSLNSVYAAEVSTVMDKMENMIHNGDMTLEEGAKPYEMTKEDYELLSLKIQRRNASRYDDDNVTNTIPVTPFLQENGYYCGPATVKQVVHYMNGSSKSQINYASLLGTTTAGTDMTKMPAVLKSETNNGYIYSTIRDYKDWQRMVTDSIKYKMPAILDIDTRGISAFPYTTTGHYVNVSGYKLWTSGRSIRITDPFQPGFGNQWYDMDSMFNANNNHWRSAVVW